MAKRAGSVGRAPPKAAVLKKAGETVTAPRVEVKTPRVEVKPPRTEDPTTKHVESRVDRLIEFIDHCAAAKTVADSIEERFLAYMLAMAIQEARSLLRGSTPGNGHGQGLLPL